MNDSESVSNPYLYKVSSVFIYVGIVVVVVQPTHCHLLGITYIALTIKAS